MVVNKEQIIAKWLLDGGCICLSCQPDDGLNLECEESPEKPAKICDALKQDIRRLLSKLEAK